MASERTRFRLRWSVCMRGSERGREKESYSQLAFMIPVSWRKVEKEKKER